MWQKRGGQQCRRTWPTESLSSIHSMYSICKCQSFLELNLQCSKASPKETNSIIVGSGQLISETIKPKQSSRNNHLQETNSMIVCRGLAIACRVGVVVVLVGLGGRSKENHHRREARINKCRDEE
jgi:hypothetical protein